MVRISPLCWKGRELYKLICFDITERKRLESQLQMRNKEYSALLKHSTKGIVRYDLSTDIAVINVDENLNQVEEYTIPHYRKMLFESGQVLAGSMPAVKALFQNMQNGNVSGEYDIQFQSPQQVRRWLRVRYVLIDDEQGRSNRAILSFFDNTLQKEKELAYQNWSARLNALLNDRSVYLEVDLTSNLYSGQQECSQEYRVIYRDRFWWYRGEIHMVKDPVTDHVKASILLKDMDNEFRERNRLKDEAERDSMTGLYNHATTERLIHDVLEQDSNEQCCFLVVDLDDLRAINSDLGHPEGDKALKTIAECMAEHFGDDAIIGRSGGDEFMALIRHVLNEEQLRATVFGFMDRLHTFKIGSNGERPIHVSVGGSVGTAGHDDFAVLYRQADLALYYTKSMGKNGFNLYRPEFVKFHFHMSKIIRVSEAIWMQDLSILHPIH